VYYAAAWGKVLHRSLWTGLTFQGRVLGDQPWTIRALMRAGDAIEVIGDTVYEWWRPHPDRPSVTIGSATRASASRAAEMADVATTAFEEVSDEADATYPDASTRGTIKRTYLDRLIRSDLAPTIRDAIERQDPDTSRLFEAVGRFVSSVPATILATSELLGPKLLRPPAANWHVLTATARASYWTMVIPALRADPHLVRGIGGTIRSPAFLAVRALGEPVGIAAGSAWLSFVGLMRLVIRRGKG
jgi:hypothetical protein